MVGQKNQGKAEPIKQVATPNAKNESKNQIQVKNDQRKDQQQHHQQTPWQKKGTYRGNRRDNRGKPHQNQHQPPQQQQQQQQQKDQATDAEAAEAVVVPAERKFTGRCRLFVGNLTNDCNEADFKKLFEPHGEYSEVFVNPSRGFGFIKMDTRQNAENAKAALDGQQRKGRVLRVRFATHGAALRVKYLPSHVSNELLEEAFSQFGDVERAIVIVDDRGRPTGEGIVEFARKPGAQQALNRINDGVFMMGTTPKPIIVEPLDQKDEEDGLPEKFIPKNQQILKEREEPPRFAPHGSFEYDFALKWKELYQMEDQQKEQVKRNMEEAAIKLEMDMETAQHEHQTMLMRQDLMRRQEELRRLEEQHQQELQRKIEMRHQEDAMRRDALQRRMDNRRTPDIRRDSVPRRQDDDMRRQEEERRHQELVMRQQQEEEMMRRQMDRGRDGEFNQERVMRDMGRERGNAPPMQPPPAPPVGLGLERNARQPGMGPGPGGMPNQGGPGAGMGGPGQGGMNNPGMGGQGSNGMGMNQQPLRQSRFDQPPQNAPSGFGNMGGGPGGNMGGQGNMNNQGAQGGNQGNQGRGGHMGNERMMERRDHREEFFESKRQRRF